MTIDRTLAELRSIAERAQNASDLEAIKSVIVALITLRINEVEEELALIDGEYPLPTK